MPALLIEDVSARFGDVVAVDGFSLAVEAGEFVTLLGPSGCGKTTTLRMVAGLERATAGRISLGSRVVSDPAAGIFVPPEQRQLGVVFQSYAIWPHMTVFENVAYPLRVRRRPAAVIREQVTKALRLVEMEAFAERPSPALSGGQQQRVAIARALVFEPQVLLLDEPLSNLDARLRSQMGDEFRALQRRLAITSLYVTHDQEEAMALSDRVVVMDRGRALQIGSPQAIYQRPASRQVAAFFGAPNLLDAKVTACEARGAGEFRLTVAAADWSGACDAARSLFSRRARHRAGAGRERRARPARRRIRIDPLARQGDGPHLPRSPRVAHRRDAGARDPRGGDRAMRRAHRRHRRACGRSARRLGDQGVKARGGRASDDAVPPPSCHRPA